jgi:hypothetical protein
MSLTLETNSKGTVRLGFDLFDKTVGCVMFTYGEAYKIMLGDFTLVVSATIAQILYFIGVAIW